MIAEGKWQNEDASKEDVFVKGMLKIVGGYDIIMEDDRYKILYNDGSVYEGKGIINEQGEFVR